MVVFARSPRAILIASLCSMAIIAFTYFVIVKPQTDNANHQVDKALQQFSPGSTSNGGSSTSGNVHLSRAEKLQACVTKAGTDTTAIQRCTAKYQP
ncbi:MAG: hypothetical protein QOJ07_1639 [Thermoleophilaceae bacterium]|jgi:hypothetical protein|nr:hypothetical protein [Thermoleophilaceae bacterium]